ncbi:hypothetical protein AC578_7387 [Pseudocercospora eumusae]|uniref:LsmAD domain-containing protein n=1 Tax=Pseudocercospora eumusae TaxID=321146 RepID=A0A139H2Z0_9PEZI|nr:hypothetical protein AC578_7387 [Pseudocercospora eumusae]
MAATMNGGDPVKPAANPPAASKQQLKSTAPSARALDAARKQAPSPVDAQHKKPQNAWSKGAPAIGNRTPSAVNGAQKPPPPAPAVSQAKSSVHPNADKHAHDRALFLFSQFVGKDVTLTLKSGEQFTGVFSGAALDGPKPQYFLKMVRRTRLQNSQQTNGDVQIPHEYIGEGEDHAMSFDLDAEISAKDIAIATASAPQQNGSAGSFMTDAQISARAYRERELQKWEPGPDTEVDLSLEASGTRGDTEWDQFAANERMYGVSSSYDEDIYTTSIDRNNPEYKRQAAKAERIAREIENSAPANAHVAEERRQDAYRGDDAGDEEEKYSGVARDSSLPKRAPGAYVPPSQRPITGAPSVPGAPYDPAIISSQIKAAPAPAPAKPAAEQPGSVEKTVLAPAETSKVAPPAATTSTEPPKKKESTTEDRVRDTADAFKQFANNEKLRLRVAQEQKRVNQRQEKNVKLNDLKKFAENFKLKSRVPDDLVPILAKDREKQLEIQKKADQAAKEEEIRAKDRDSEKANSVTASPAPSSSVSQAAPTPSTDSRAPFNQQNRARVGQQGRQQVPPGQSATGISLSQRLRNNQMQFNNGRPVIQPLPAELRIPSGPPQSMGADMPMSPNSATRLNVNAKSFEFRPGASAFTPTGTSPSPQRKESEEVVSFFSKGKKKETKSLTGHADAVKRMAESDYPEHLKGALSKNGGVPQAFSTQPTWSQPKERENTAHETAYPKLQAPSSGPSPMHTPNPGQMPHAHQLPAHMQGPPTMPGPNQRQPFYGQPQHGHGHGPSFDPRLQQQFGPNGSVQNSPRVQQVPAVPFNGQMPPMQMQQFPGQPMPQYGMSPSMQYRQMAPQGTPMMMPGGPQPQMMPMRPGFGGPQFNPQMGGGHMMVQNPSQGYQNGPMAQGYGGSPMPPNAQPHMPHMQPHGSFSGSPRPHMMSHQGSHQGFQPGMPMQPHFAPAPAPYPHHMQHRAMSSGYPQMTPRQQAAVPHQPSPGMGVAQGDEGK